MTYRYLLHSLQQNCSIAAAMLALFFGRKKGEFQRVGGGFRGDLRDISVWIEFHGTAVTPDDSVLPRSFLFIQAFCDCVLQGIENGQCLGEGDVKGCVMTGLSSTNDGNAEYA
ncbi:hypothetical protein [Neopusillimonas aromaticivorans]|uniref:hypothetical protein n=1 Tax=Neopusillimonas aromaticivorans TaxID=2979868 RepID=UPI0025964187|nr:hypothetical protein [Neopusillimonas aromaticivorans]WJJ93807.1 hypothetical protein N7E01_00595 [Neopusillimonas aromaticivorans]